MHRLTVFDVDGTLTESMGVDTECFVEAVAEHFGLSQIDTRWERYTSSTDAGLLREIVDTHGLKPSDDEMATFESRFAGKLDAALRRNQSLCRPIGGASEAISTLIGRSDFSMAIATGGYAKTARMKLTCAGLDCEGIPFASSNDSHRRETITTKAVERAGWADRDIQRVTYIGDAVWDVRAARNLGCNFVGIAASPEKAAALRTAGATLILRDYSDRARFVQALSSDAEIRPTS